jgi:hypothetical protein
MPFPRTLSRGGTFSLPLERRGWLRDLFENGIAVVFVFSSVVVEEGIE